MAKDKKGFILYADQRSIFEMLSDEKAGELIKYIFSYVNDENPITEDMILKLAFEPIKLQLKRDLKKWDGIKSKRSEAGKKGAEARWQTMANDGKRILPMAKMAVNVNDNVTDNVKVKDKGIYSDNVFLKITEYNHLLTKFGEDKTNEYIERLSIYLHKTGKEYASHYHTILDWISKDEEKELALKNQFKGKVAR